MKAAFKKFKPTTLDCGLGSNYHRCCIKWFQWRGHGPFWHLSDAIRHIIAGNAYWNFEHVVCPLCCFIYRFKSFAYYTCDKCDWTQFNKRECNACTHEVNASMKGKK